MYASISVFNFEMCENVDPHSEVKLYFTGVLFDLQEKETVLSAVNMQTHSLSKNIFSFDMCLNVFQH